MNFLKEVCAQHSKWKNLEIYIARMEAYPDNGPLIVDNCKCIIETICKTILEDLHIPKEEHKVRLPELARQTAAKLLTLNKAPDLIEAFVNMAFRIARFRNEYTESGHGQSIYVIDENNRIITASSIVYLESVIEQTAIYLITLYQDEYPMNVKSLMRYEDNVDFNKEFDELFEDKIEIGNFGPYNQSELLFYIDKGAYITSLEEFNNK